MIDICAVQLRLKSVIKWECLRKMYSDFTALRYLCCRGNGGVIQGTILFCFEKFQNYAKDDATLQRSEI